MTKKKFDEARQRVRHSSSESLAGALDDWPDISFDMPFYFTTSKKYINVSEPHKCSAHRRRDPALTTSVWLCREAPARPNTHSILLTRLHQPADKLPSASDLLHATTGPHLLFQGWWTKKGLCVLHKIAHKCVY